MQELRRYHPFVITAYILIGILITAMTSHLFLQLVFLCMTWMLLLEFPELSLRKQIRYNLMMISITSIINPLFQSRGVVILCSIGSLPVTLEALSYGAYLGCMLSTLINFMKMFSHMIHTDQILYMLHYISPSAAILCSISMQQFSRLKKQYDDVRYARALLQGKQTRMQHCREQVMMFASLMSWLMEQGVDTSISMRSLGYGLGKRSVYHHYVIERRDQVLLLILCLLFIGLCVGMLGIQFAYFPTWYQVIQFPHLFLFIVCFLLYAILPMLLSRKEVAIWEAIE